MSSNPLPDGMAIAAETPTLVSAAPPPHLGTRRPGVGSVPPDPAGARRDRGGARLPALQPRPALVPAVRALRADPACRHARRPPRTSPRCCTTRSSGTRCSGRSSSRRERRPDDRDRHRARDAAAAAQHVGAHPADVRARPRLVDAGRRRGAGLVLDDELPERRRQLRADAAAARRLLPPRLVRVDVLAARHRHGVDRLGCAARSSSSPSTQRSHRFRASSSRRRRSTARRPSGRSATSRCRSSSPCC